MKTVDYILLLIFSNTNLYKQIQRWHMSKFNDWCLRKQSLIIVLKGSMCSSHSKIKQPSNSNLGFVPNESILLKCLWDLLRLSSLGYTYKTIWASPLAQQQWICLQCRRLRRQGFDPLVGKIPWRRKWQPTPVFLPGKFHRQSSLVGCSP